jgi:hypothetical protein
VGRDASEYSRQRQPAAEQEGNNRARKTPKSREKRDVALPGNQENAKTRLLRRREKFANPKKSREKRRISITGRNPLGAQNREKF